MMKWKAKSAQAFELPDYWRQLPQGSAYSSLISDYFESRWAPAAGRRLVKFGGLSAAIPCAADCQQIVLAPKTRENFPAFSPQSAILIEDDLQELPFGDGTVDACLLANTLNFSQDPHQLLRECERILSDNGYLYISLFDPFSRLLFKRRLNGFPYRRFCRWRVIDWLELLGFEILHHRRLPLKHEPKWLASLAVIIAQKHSIPLTLQPQKAREQNFGALNPAQAFQEQINT